VLEERGVGAELRAAILAEARRLGISRGAAALDVGAGTGLLLAELRSELDVEAWALDLSPHAVERCSRRYGVRGVVANADRGLPFADSEFALVVSCTGPRPVAELARVLAPDGVLLVAIPAPDDLIELREAAQGEGRLVDRVSKALVELSPRFELERRETVRARRVLDRAALDALLAATYRGARAELLTLRST
jgi:23S rRNA (guanine745-N1)-methyltransferase